MVYLLFVNHLPRIVGTEGGLGQDCVVLQLAHNILTNNSNSKQMVRRHYF
jgi:hypothetical protein